MILKVLSLLKSTSKDFALIRMKKHLLEESVYSRYNEFKSKFRLAMICLKEENIASVRNMIDDDGRIA
jgi:hypothetical protein